MAKRSLQASEEGIRKAKQAFKRKGWTQEYLAATVGLETRQPIWKFFTGKPIDRQAFNEICIVLDLNPLEISQNCTEDEITPSEQPLNTYMNFHLDIESLVKKLRSAQYERIQAQCGTVHILDIARPIGINELYVDVNILEEINSKRWVDINDLQPPDREQFERFGLGKVRQKRVSGQDVVLQYSKLMLLGKPGAGKTTFLQSLAINCNQGNFLPDCLPIFINLKNFAEDTRDLLQPSLVKYIHKYFAVFDITEQQIITVLSQGKVLLLLDALDEVAEQDSEIILKNLRQFIEIYHKNIIVITCRVAAQYYRFQGFTEVEIADFTKSQITTFANKWFLAVAKKSPAKAQSLARKFIQKLELAENVQILELASTPILLNLTCLLFQFVEDFPSKRAELYKQGLDLLLVRWDEARGIKRDQIYRNFSLLQKIKLLSRIAAITFAQGEYFLPEKKMHQLIGDYLSHIPQGTHDADALELESAAVLKAIEAQHGLLVERARGIYSFSHLTFQEYFTAREIFANANTQTLKELVEQINEERWREIFLLTVEMLQPADELLQLMKQQIDRLATVNEKLEDFLNWLIEKSSTVKGSYHPASVRAFYFTIALPPEHPLARTQNFAISLDPQMAGNLSLDLALDLALTHALSVSVTITADIFSQRLFALSLALDLEHLLIDEPSLQTSIKLLKNQLPSPKQGREALKMWWQTHGEGWIRKLRTLIIGSRQIGHAWQFNEQEWQNLQQYWYANQLLLDCLNSATNVTPNVRQSIENTLLLVGG
ncbi:putative signal transduction protein containing Nacht domain [Tolypothrix tenuis PCC 7101]|uniref:Putative signal transduction protein containing Nacht domain n=1 Tax=Tolypothrix tenuis PCC 7101 TaxID=231146 RepID=A0A1Z4MX54_9CYAN|nr:NACHT domain-containing NTPase [Aulosira sp. FACHB-113]BAY98064.1 putative signal transduction protein containing Nacht domain [Tolypothrix tenuis PCC 7101]BAZ78017.1 putative signal transduction protein containing Nacht domain [Aulosira laxa NIES-50]